MRQRRDSTAAEGRRAPSEAPAGAATEAPAEAFTKALVVLSTLLAGIAAAGAAGAPAPDPCALLADAEIRSVQNVGVIERIRSTPSSAPFEIAGCFYRTADHNGSVSLTLSLPRPERPDEVRRYWDERFHPESGFPEGKRQPPKPIRDLGEEAFWVGDPVAGSLYVLAGRGFLRLSVGGAPDDATRRARSLELARAALGRLGPRAAARDG